MTALLLPIKGRQTASRPDSRALGLPLLLVEHELRYFEKGFEHVIGHAQKELGRRAGENGMMLNFVA